MSKLSQALLENGREKYLQDWLKGISRGMDAYCQSVEIELEADTAKHLLSYCKENIDSKVFPNRETADHVVEFFEFQTRQH